MNETIRLYDLNAYETKFTAEVISCEEVTVKSGKKPEAVYDVILDRTLFFPEEGGQTCDKGVLDGQPVLAVAIRKNVIHHHLAAPIAVGSKVEGEIDWTHRFNNMQQHSGEHLFSGLVNKRFGFDNVGFHLSEQNVTMDFNGVIPADAIEEIELEVNRAIAKNFETVITFPSKEELSALNYRSKIEIEGQVRLVCYPGYDTCACCAPHVRRTGEIGLLKVMSVQNYKGGVRVSILCGFRAMQAFREKAAVISDLTGFLTTGQEQLPEVVRKLKNDNQKLSSQLAQAKLKLLGYAMKEIPADAVDALLFEQDLEGNIIRNGVNLLMETHEGFCGIFSGNDENGYNFVIGSKAKDCKELSVLLRQQLMARGGGSREMIQGSVKASREAIEALFHQN